MPSVWQRVAPSFLLEVRITREPMDLRSELGLKPASPAMLPLAPAADTIR